MSLLEAKNVASGYDKLTVLHDASITVEEGEIVAIIGANGAGKSTMMKTIYQLLPLTAGTLRFNGTDLNRTDPRDNVNLKMGYVPQERNTFPELSVEDNLHVSTMGMGRSEAKAARDAMYSRFPILGKRHRQAASTLSGGERQMLALASAMITSPLFLTLDEPTTGLAPSIVDQLIDHILAFRDDGGTVLWVIEENPLQILKHVDRAYLMQAGVVDGEVEQSLLVDEEAMREYFFGVAGDGGDTEQVAGPA